MNIQFVRLEDDVCTRVNDVAREQERTVSDLVNEIVRQHLSMEAAASRGDNPMKPAK